MFRAMTDSERMSKNKLQFTQSLYHIKYGRRILHPYKNSRTQREEIRINAIDDGRDLKNTDSQFPMLSFLAQYRTALKLL